jgi:hypothetical protein
VTKVDFKPKKSEESRNMRINFAFPTLILSIAASGLLHAQSFTSTVVATTGDPAPGGNGTFNTIGLPTLNDSGLAAFSGGLTGTSGGANDDAGFFAGSGGTLTQLAREGQSVPGSGVIASFSQAARLNNSGLAAFFANLTGTSGGASDNSGIFAGSGGALTQIVREGQAVPDGNGLFGNPTPPALNDNGLAAFSSMLTGTTGGTNDNNGIFAGSGGAITQILRKGQSAPDSNGAIFGFTAPVLNNNAQVAFSAQLTGTSGGATDSNGMFLGSGGPITQIARGGQSAPGGNGVFSVFSPPTLNDNGLVVFPADLTGTSGGTTDNNGIFAGSGGALTQIAREGQSAPDGNGLFAIFNAGSLRLNENGVAVFISTLSGTSGGTSDSRGIFSGSGGAVTQIARRGQTAPNGNGTFAFLSAFSSPVVNDDGQVAFFVDLAGTSGGTTDDAAIFFYDPASASLSQVVRKGDSLLGSTITDFIYLGGTLLGDELGGLNNSAQVAYSFTLADGRQGVAIAKPPVLQLTAAVSRKMHGMAGTFDINLPLTGPLVGVECRSSGGVHTLVFTFTNNVISGNATVTDGMGTAGSPSFTGTTMTVNLSGVTDVQKITVTLNAVTDSFAQVLPDTAVSMNLLIGDTNGSKAVNATDVGQTKTQSGVPVTAANFRQDVTPNGGINATDIGLVKTRSGAFVP